MASPRFWDDKERAKKEIERLTTLRSAVEPWKKLKKEIKDLSILLQLSRDEGDEETGREVRQGLKRVVRELNGLELLTIFTSEQDKKNAILSIHPGAGGTESCDWAQMLLRMYSRWAERKGLGCQIVDILPGEEAGIKSATLLVKGDYAYGYLKAESGVHRLVRISPFDASHRRHTSFTSIDVIPEVDEDVKVEIKESDLRIDTFRASGHGGQHVNVTDSAVRITHLPTSITAQCQNERSQHQNKAIAMRILRARFYEHFRKKREEELSKELKERKEISWGSQVRSYVFHPYNLVKDHRTKIEVGNVQAVMDGEIDRFIEAYLRSKKS